MTIDPRDRNSWYGFLDLLRPPTGHRLVAAFGTAFGLSFDALTAALLAMMGTDGEELARDPVAGVIAITRLRGSVRVLIHPGTIVNPGEAMPKRLIGLLDRFVAEVRPKTGLFHPKLWVLRFKSVEASQKERETCRVIVCSRNLTGSRSFELAAVLEGQPTSAGESSSPVAKEVASAMEAWLDVSTNPPRGPVRELGAFLRGVTLDLPHEARDGAHFHRQGLGVAPLDRHLPAKCERAVVISPFVRPDFVSRMLDRSGELRLISTAECLDSLDDTTFAATEARRQEQGTPVLYQVDEYGDPDDAFIDGIHAKLVLVEGPRLSATFVGSANATGPAWGFSGPSNVEAMLELRPGITVGAFVKAFIWESKDKAHPWIKPYDRLSREDPDPDRELERQLLGALRSVGMLELALRYNEEQQELRLSSARANRVDLRSKAAAEFRFSVAPLSVADQPAAWHPLADLRAGEIVFDGIALADVTAFVSVRASNLNPPMEKTRVMLARLHMDDTTLDRRDDLARQHLLAEADPAAVLHALIRGVAHLRPRSGPHRPGTPGGRTIQQLLAHTGLEHVLQAVAQDYTLVADLKSLLGGHGDEAFQIFCIELEDACKAITLECTE